ncbi:hypothetical protein GCM10027075_01340 [Streptomyces heilongjiangensis]
MSENADVTTVPLGRVIPAPARVEAAGTPYRLDSGARVVVDGGPEARRVGEYLAGVLRPSTGYRLPVTDRTTGEAGDVRLRSAAHETALGREGYRLRSARSGVTITARTAAGLFHGVQTLRQSLPPVIERDSVQPGPWTVAGGTVEDVPRYAWRGAMLDVSRHFFTVDQVKRYVDQLALHKFNKLHLHLSDDQGWRIAIDSWPRLATHGGSTQVGGGPGGFYLDMKYDKDTPLGLDWAGYVEVRRSYDRDPGAYLDGVPASAVRGVEAPLWTETVVTPADMDRMVFPRLPGVAELGWLPASTHDWNGYRVRLAAQGPRWEALGIGYHRSPQVDWPAW